MAHRRYFFPICPINSISGYTLALKNVCFVCTYNLCLIKGDNAYVKRKDGWSHWSDENSLHEIHVTGSVFLLLIVTLWSLSVFHNVRWQHMLLSRGPDHVWLLNVRTGNLDAALRNLYERTSITTPSHTCISGHTNKAIYDGSEIR